jgi:hypothetical protein
LRLETRQHLGALLVATRENRHLSFYITPLQGRKIVGMFVSYWSLWDYPQGNPAT